MATTNIIQSTSTDNKFYKPFDSTKDIVTNISKEYNTNLNFGISAISPTQIGDTDVYQYEYNNTVFATSYTASSTSPDDLKYAAIQSLLRNDVGSTQPWIPVITDSFSKQAKHIVVISFTNTVIGDRIKIDDFNIKHSSTNLYATPIENISPQLNYDLNPMYRSNCALLFNTNNQTTIGDGTKFKGLLFAQLGIILLYSDDTALSIQSITPVIIQKQQIFNSKTFFCRLTNQSFNASNNSTWIKKHQDNSNTSDIYTCPTTIGLYNDNKQLLAIAKLSEPVIKQADTQLHVQVVLQY